MRRKFPNVAAWEMQVMKEPEIDGVPYQEATSWLGVTDEELERLIDDGTLNVADICDGTGQVTRSLVRTLDIRNWLAKRKPQLM
jgi:hypothetical protein